MSNEDVKILFMRMINSPEKISDISNGNIIFDNGLKIYPYKRSENSKEIENEPMDLKSLERFSPFLSGLYYLSSLDVEEDHLMFRIVTPYRTYDVPDITERIEYARVLNKIESDIREFEDKMFNSYLEYFNI